MRIATSNVEPVRSSACNSPSNFSTITKSIPMDFSGTTIELRGFLRTEDVSDFVGLAHCDAMDFRGPRYVEPSMLARGAPSDRLHGLPANRLRNGKLFLRQAKTKHSVWVPLPSKVVKALKACDEGEKCLLSLRSVLGG